MVHTIENSTILKLRNQPYDVLIQYPLELTTDEAEFEYLSTVLQSTPIYVSLQISLGSLMKITPSVVFPISMTATRLMGVPTYHPNDTPLEFNAHVKDALLRTWGHRKALVEAFQTFTAVLEYDATDFSFLSYTVRVTHQKMYMVCVAELRLTCGFPDVEPLVMLHFLQQNHSVPLENLYTRIKYAKGWTVDKIAKEIFCIVYKWIEETAFGAGS